MGCLHADARGRRRPERRPLSARLGRWEGDRPSSLLTAPAGQRLTSIVCGVPLQKVLAERALAAVGRRSGQNGPTRRSEARTCSRKTLVPQVVGSGEGAHLAASAQPARVARAPGEDCLGPVASLGWGREGESASAGFSCGDQLPDGFA